MKEAQWHFCWLALAASLPMVLSACSGLPPTLPQRLNEAEAWQAGMVHGGAFELAYAHRGAESSVAEVYLEGDGRAFISRQAPSSDPTPAGFAAANLAEIGGRQDPASDLWYLARPCQYNPRQAACSVRVWTRERFSAGSAAALREGLVGLVGQKPVVLIGYSGGAVLALELAKELPQVVGVVTVAGNLDPAATARWHHVSVLGAEIAPLNAPGRLAEIPVINLVGDKDPVIPAALSQKVLAASSPSTGPLPCGQLTVVPEATHQTGWIEWWTDHRSAVLQQVQAGCPAAAGVR